MKPGDSDLNKVLKSVTPKKPSNKRTLYDSDETKRAAKLLGSKGGSKGGPARARALSPKRRSEIAAQGGAAAKRKRGGK